MVRKKSVVLFANGFLRPTQLRHHMEGGSQWKRGEDNFITLHVGKMAAPLFSGPTGPWVKRSPPAASTRSSAAASQVMCFPPLSPADLRGCCERCGSLSPRRCGPCSSPLRAPVLSPPEPERRQICTARKRAAAAIIALIACFFCQAEISGGATIRLKPPKTSE